ncbi:MAG: hypothetical protein IPF46_05265 [Saprospiraceae bacterium]|nr:hypothetical protein [Candidatus Vicinibacter affinis]HQX45321.1 hypothetical protein [Saprospiraceae bacterium]MBK6572152.1 hypothetical protein [Candidatus Vicinibacter affinis]MBK7305067.1 hypothetical protein [Candidatus Vicinibacter affinis]MBK7694032.1 hypothetical protein [Candidatus Vicinibacter affinis]
MKKLFFFSAFVLFLGSLNLSAQSCSQSKKACCAAKASSCTKSASVSDAALKAAESDASIEKRTCKDTKSVCFYKNSVDANGNKVAQEVVYDEAKATFVNYTASEASTTPNSGKSCGSKKGKCCSKGSASTGEVKSSGSVN